MTKRSYGFLLFVAFSLFGCHRILPPTSLKSMSIAVPVFENKTLEPVLAGTLTSVLKERLRRSFEITSKTDETVYVLTGTLNRIVDLPKSLNQDGKGFVYRVTLNVTYHLTYGHEAPIQWEDTAYADWISRLPDILNDRLERDRALHQIGLELSHRAANYLTEIVASKDRVLKKTARVYRNESPLNLFPARSLQEQGSVSPFIE